MTLVAIDFGTSNTVVSFLEPDTQQPKTLRFPKLSRRFELKTDEETQEVFVVPSLVYIQNNTEIIFGENVRSQRLGLSQPQRLFKTFKRDLSADFQPLPRQIDGEYYTAQSVAELFLKEIWQQLLNLNVYPSEVIFTVPVGAFERYLDWLRDVAKSLNLPNVKIIDESTAAALGYAIKQPETLVLVVDFGGGTLDLSLVRTVAASSEFNSQFKLSNVLTAEVIAKSDAYIGGTDIDIWIVEDYLRKNKSSRESIGEIAWQNLIEIAERLKIRLSGTNEARESWLDDENFMTYELILNRQQLEEILEHQQFLEQLRETLDEILEIAVSKGISKNQIAQVLLVGGSCLIPSVKNLITSYFGKSKVHLTKPFEAVVHGALFLNELMEVKDYLRHSYAIRLWEPATKSYSYYTLFEQGLKYPCQRTEPLILQVAVEGQQEIRLDIGELAQSFQTEVAYDEQGRMTSGNLNKTSEYRSLESHHQQVCVAHLNPLGVLGIDRISVQFEVDERRMLLATIKDLLTENILVERGAIAQLT